MVRNVPRRGGETTVAAKVRHGLLILAVLAGAGADVAFATVTDYGHGVGQGGASLAHPAGWLLYLGVGLGLVAYAIGLWRIQLKADAGPDQAKPDGGSNWTRPQRSPFEVWLGRLVIIACLVWLGTAILAAGGVGGLATLDHAAFWATALLPAAHILARRAGARASATGARAGAIPPALDQPTSPRLFDLVLKHVEQVGDGHSSPRRPPARRHGAGGFGELVALRPLMQDVVELTIAMHAPLAWRPGQHVNVCFEGFPARAHCPTVALDGKDVPGTFRLHVKRREGGRVSGEIGRSIRIGHRVAIDGPYGAEYLCTGERRRLVLFAGGVGFAPIWSIADAARRESAVRDMVVVVGVRSINAFYMAEALERMARCSTIAVLPVAAEPQSVLPQIGEGHLASFAHVMAPGDIVHAAGAAAMVDALAVQAATMGVAFNAMRFTPSPRTQPPRISRSTSSDLAQPHHLWPGGGGQHPHPAFQLRVSEPSAAFSRRGTHP